MQFFGEEEVMSVDKSSERFFGLVRSQRKRAKVIRDVLTMILTTSHKRRVEEGSGLRVRWEFQVHLGVLRKLGLLEGGSTQRSALWHMGINLVSVTRCCRSSVVGEGTEVDDGIPGDHVGELRCSIFRGSSLEVLGFLVELEIMCWVVGWLWLECVW